MSDGPAPQTVRDITAWAHDNAISIREARDRFAQFAILSGIGRHNQLRLALVFKGGNALDFVWNPNRSTRDLDCTLAADGTSQVSGSDDIRLWITQGMISCEAIHGVTARIQRWDLFPRGQGHQFPAVQASIGYALSDQLMLRGRMVDGGVSAQVIPIDISFNDPVCASEVRELERGSSLFVATLEDIIAEKLRALLQQPIRNRSRRQDVLDLAVVLGGSIELDHIRIAEFLQVKARAKDIAVSKTAFHHQDIRRRSSQDYAQLATTTRHTFIPFDEAFAAVLAFVDQLEIPD